MSFQSQSGMHFASPGKSGFYQAAPEISVPLQIEGQSFILEIADIQNIEIIDMNEKPKKGGNILDQINNSGLRDKSGLSAQDKKFFKQVFDNVQESTPIEPEGKNYVEPKPEPIVSNFDTQFPEKVEWLKQAKELEKKKKKLQEEEK